MTHTAWMRARAVLPALAVLLLAGCGGGGGAERGPGERPPNIILIVVDTLRADVLLTRRDLVDTPAIDAFAREPGAVSFPRAYAHAPMTLPSHTALFSSRHPFETKVVNNGQEVPGDLPLFAEHLSELGYQTRAAVSLGTLWPNLTEDTALDRGFDVFLHAPNDVAPASQVHPVIEKALEGVDPEQPLFFFAHFCDPHEPYDVHGVREDGSPPFVATLSLDGAEIATVTTSDMTYFSQTFELGPGKHRFGLDSERKSNIRMLKISRDGDPVTAFFLDGDEALPARNGTRTPLTSAVFEFDGPEDGTDEFKIDAWITDCPLGRTVPYRYSREVSYVDGEVGKLIARLKEKGLYSSSIVVFTSDHGEALGEHKFQGHVQNLYDEMLHVPLIFKLPEGSERTEDLERASKNVVRHVDVIPTLLDLAGLAALPGQRGLSLLRDGDRTLISETHAPEAKETQVMLRDAEYKLIFYPDREAAQGGGGSGPAREAFEMYWLTKDPFELENVFEEHRSKRPKWPDQLRVIARLSEGAGLELEALSEDERARLEGMGYFGGTEDEEQDDTGADDS